MNKELVNYNVIFYDASLPFKSTFTYNNQYYEYIMNKERDIQCICQRSNRKTVIVLDLRQQSSPCTFCYFPLTHECLLKTLNEEVMSKRFSKIEIPFPFIVFIIQSLPKPLLRK